MKEEFKIVVGEEYKYTGQTYQNPNSPKDLVNGENVVVTGVDGENIHVRTQSGGEAVTKKDYLNPISAND